MAGDIKIAVAASDHLLRKVTITSVEFNDQGAIKDVSKTETVTLDQWTKFGTHGTHVRDVDGSRGYIVEVGPPGQGQDVKGRWRFVSEDEDETLDALASGQCTVHMHGDGRG